eukprot:666299-Rhodomonas_salina.1
MSPLRYRTRNAAMMHECSPEKLVRQGGNGGVERDVRARDPGVWILSVHHALPLRVFRGILH